jgi:hypothetical protein
MTRDAHEKGKCMKFNGRVLAAIAAVVLGVTLGGFVAGCKSDADKAAKNISTAAEQFKVQRRIVGVNGITDKVEFVVEGRCSIEGDGLGQLAALVVTCKQGPHDYRKHYIGMSDNMFFISTQLRGIDVSVYRTKIILKPQNIVPDLDLVTG